MTCTCLKCGRAFRAYGPAPKDRCHACRREIRRATWREAQQRRRAGVPSPPRACLGCRADISTRPPQAVYCVPCAQAARRATDREQQHQRRAHQAVGRSYGAPRDLALEARIDAYLRAIRRSGRYGIEDVIWARRVDPVAEAAEKGAA